MPILQKTDTIWILGLYGTAIGAGVLFLPITIGNCGLLQLIIIAIISFPITFLSHRGITRFVLSGNNKCKNIIDVINEHFGHRIGNIITLMYFFSIYPILLIYSVAITNTVESLIINQICYKAPSRIFLSFILIFSLNIIIILGNDIIIKSMSILVFPLIITLIIISFYLIPYWNITIFYTQFVQIQNNNENFFKTLFLTLPIIVFAFNHLPIISSFAIFQREKYGNNANIQSSRILIYSNLLMVITVMFFVFSCILSLTPEHLKIAKNQNISILSYLSNHLDNVLIANLGPIITLIAMIKSFFGHYIGASEGFISLFNSKLYEKKIISYKKIRYFTTLFMILTTWLAAVINPNIIKIIEIFIAPIIAIFLFFIPTYAIIKVPNMICYRGLISNYFIVCFGILTLLSTLFNLISLFF